MAKKNSDPAQLANQIKLNHVLDAIDDCMLVVDSQGYIVVANKQCFKVFGYKPKELVGKIIEDLVPTKTRKKHVALRESYNKDPHGRWMNSDRKLHGEKKSGESVPLDISLMPITIDDKNYVITLCRDVTKREAQEKMKDAFISTAGHELRTPLTSINGAIEILMQDSSAFPNEAQVLMKMILSNTQKLTFLVNDLLDVQKIDSDKLTLTQEKHALLELAKLAVQDNQHYSSTKNVKLIVAKKNDLVFASLDINRFRQILDNLISNAVKFSPQKGVVEVAVNKLDGKAVVSVKDQGSGIPSDFVPRMFQQFSQADQQVSRKYAGTGLGLYLVKKLVELHGGKIDFKTSGKGTTFFVRLPLTD